MSVLKLKVYFSNVMISNRNWKQVHNKPQHGTRE